MKILVTGGSGYIGSFMVKRLLEDDHEVLILDKNEPRFSHDRLTFLKGNLLDREFLSTTFSTHNIDAIIHFAAFISMGESMQDPYKYFENNTYGSLNLFEVGVQHGLKHLIFSSTAGVYGNPEKTPIPEDHPKNPTNPYGESKLMSERLLSWYQDIHGLNSVSLRYFNACGAALDGSMGESHTPETHIIPAAINALHEDREFKLFGTDYDTPDGTTIRDYIHVLDLVEAHVMALELISKSSGALVYNVGTGNGHSNREVLDMIQQVSGKKLSIAESDRRPGDANILIADASKIKQDFGFEPKYSDLETIVSSAWKWHSKS